MAGVGLEELEEGSGEVRRTAFVHALLFVAGFSIVFMGLGASASVFGHVLHSYQLWIARIGGIVVIVFGLHLLGITPIRFLLRERRVQLQNRPVGMLGAVVVGVTFGAGWAPCIGPVLGAILTYAATQERLAEGVGLLAVYSAGLAVPFLLAAAALSRFLTVFRRFRRYIPWVERVRVYRRAARGRGPAARDRRVHGPGLVGHALHARVPPPANLERVGSAIRRPPGGRPPGLRR